MDEYDSVLIYDGECPYCSIAAKALERLDTVGAISWYDETAQRFLEAQFDETPFAMFLVDSRRKQVYAGRAAAEEIAQRASMPNIVSQLVRKNSIRLRALSGLQLGEVVNRLIIMRYIPSKKQQPQRFNRLLRPQRHRHPRDSDAG